MTGETHILNTIKQVKAKNPLLNYVELISVLNGLKTISEHQNILHNIIQSIETLNTNPLSEKWNLTKRESQVFQLIGQGLQSSTIATQLSISVSTVETHRKHIRKKLKLKEYYHQ